MAISVFPAAGGGAVNNDFVIDMAGTSNNVADLPRAYSAGAYQVSLSSGDTSFDIYFLDASGSAVGYSNESTIVASAEFESVSVLGVGTTEVLTFTFAGASTDADSEGDATGAGAYLESISPSDLPTIDDTATVTGGNFATDVEIYFESGAVSTEAKNVTRNDSTELIVTRPDALDPALDPWDVKAINPGVTPPTGSNAHILAGTVDAGATPVWTTTSPLPQGTAGQPYTATVVATDAEGDVTYSVTAGSLPPGLTLAGSTGVISGTPTGGSAGFTLAATDDGGNSNTRDFVIPLQLATGGSVTTDGLYTVHTFDTSDDFVALADISNAEYLVVAGGGSGSGANNNASAGGGGAGGYRSSIAGESTGGGGTLESPITINQGTIAITVGAGGAAVPGATTGNSGGDSSIGNLIVSIGGGRGGRIGLLGADGGSGGGGGQSTGPGSGTPGQGFDGFNPSSNQSGGGGGAAQAGSGGTNIANGITSSATGSSETYARGGAGANNSDLVGSNAVGRGSGGHGDSRGFTDGGKFGNDGRVVIRYQ